MFIDDEELIEAEVFYKKEGRHYLAYNTEIFKNMDLSEEEQKEYTKLTVKLKPLTWGLYNELQEAAMVSDNLGNRKWNYKAFKENKLRGIIAKWDAKIKDDEDKLVIAPINPKTIRAIAPDIAEVIINTYDQITLIDEDEEKKS